MAPNNESHQARAMLTSGDGSPTPQYRRYLELQEEYNQASRLYREAFASAQADPMKLQRWPLEGVEYQRQVDQAMDRWVSLGFKNEIERALAETKAAGVEQP